MTLYYTPKKAIRKPLKVGELVDVCNRDLETMSVRKVVRSGKKVVVTDCDRRWRADDGLCAAQ